MNGHQLKKLLREGHRAFGTMFVTARTGRWDNTIRDVGFDLVVVDNEHAPYSRAETADWMAKLAEMDIVPFLRLPTARGHHVRMAFDSGAQGVIIPCVETLEQVRMLVAAKTLRPLKGEMARQITETGVYPSTETRRYLEEVNQNNVLALGIESVAALARLDELLAVEGVDAVFVATPVLSLQLGVPNQYEHPTVVAAIGQILAACQRHGRALMIHAFSHDQAVRWLKAGANAIVFGTDRRTLSEGFIGDVEYLRQVSAEVGAPAKPRLRVVYSENKIPDR